MLSVNLRFQDLSEAGTDRNPYPEYAARASAGAAFFLTRLGIAVPFLINSWKTQDGLPQNSVLAIAQTPDGYLWIGTKGGLSRFDVVQFKNYGLADGLKSLNVRAGSR